MALSDAIADPALLTGTGEKSLSVAGTDWPDLMVNWLRELLYIWHGEGCLVKGSDISFISETRLSARVVFDPYDPDKHVLENEIKAVTYHDIRVEETGTGWQATIIFDV